MNVLKKVHASISANPKSESSRLLARLAIAIEKEENFSLSELYKLDEKSFGLALDLLKVWREDRYYGAKFKLLDLVDHAAAAN
ncbi:MAG: hypothetical protein V4568_17790 [Pseudomonadota bacterium]